jgi:Cu/Ag efflux protein CusF
MTGVAAFRVSADQTAVTAKPERHYQGMIVSVDPQEHTLKTRGFILSKHFSLGNTCGYDLLDKTPGTIGDLRPGEKVKIRYQDADGVLVADRVEQVPMRYEGMVKAVDPAARTLTLHLRGLDETFRIADGCGVVLRDDKSGTLDDIQTGDHVTVTYEKPKGKLVARQIAQTSIEFTGTLSAIDLESRTLKARETFGSKQFVVGNHCAIMTNDKPDGRLNDLRLNEKVVLNYDEINGVNVVNRIAPAEPPSHAVTANSETLAGN